MLTLARIFARVYINQMINCRNALMPNMWKSLSQMDRDLRADVMTDVSAILMKPVTHAHNPIRINFR